MHKTLNKFQLFQERRDASTFENWFQRFQKQEDDITLTLRDKTFKKSKCKYLGRGSEKQVYQLEGTNQCFFIPGKTSVEEFWHYTIESEKNLLDQIDSVGLKSQRFEIAPLKINKPGEPSYTLKVLITKAFSNLCEEESITIFNPKGGDEKVIGINLDFMAIKNQVKNQSFAQKMLKKIINEYVIAFTFSLPISILKPSIDDSQHLCFELSKDPNEPPIVRYMFWDVVSDFTGITFPYLPTLDEIKAGTRKKSVLAQFPTHGLFALADTIAGSMKTMFHCFLANENKNKEEKYVIIEEDEINLIANAFEMEAAVIKQELINARDQSVQVFNSTVKNLLEFIPPEKKRSNVIISNEFDENEIRSSLFTVLLNEDILQEALSQARERGLAFFNKQLNALSQEKKIELFIEIMKSAISLDNLKLVQDTFAQVYPAPNNLPETSLNKIINAAKKYKNQTIIDYLESRKEPKLEEKLQCVKSEFFKIPSMNLAKSKEFDPLLLLAKTPANKSELKF